MPKLVVTPLVRAIAAVVTVGALGTVAVTTQAPDAEVVPVVEQSPSASPVASPSPVAEVSVSSTLLTTGGESGVGSLTVEIENPGSEVKRTLEVRCISQGSVVFSRKAEVTLAAGTTSKAFTSEAMALEGVTCTATI